MTGKTLKELNVQVGDVVQYTPLGGVSTITHILGGKYYGTGENRDFPYCSYPAFTLVSRAKKYTAWQFTPAPENAETHAMPDGSIAWRVEVVPVVEKVTKYMRADNGGWTSSPNCTKTTHRLTYNTIDGDPDCASVKMELLP